MNFGTLFRTKSVELIQRDAAMGFSDSEGGGHKLKRTLGVLDLTSMETYSFGRILFYASI